MDIIIISSKCNLFSPWYGWKIVHLALNNNHSLTHLKLPKKYIDFMNDIFVIYKYWLFTGAICSAAVTIQNGQRTIVAGDLTAYASIIRYDCDEGYELVGTPILFCQSDKQWSASTPSCQS